MVEDQLLPEESQAVADLTKEGLVEFQYQPVDSEQYYVLQITWDAGIYTLLYTEYNNDTPTQGCSVNYSCLKDVLAQVNECMAQSVDHMCRFLQF